MTAYDLLLLIATLCLVLLTGFACAVLYYVVQVLKIWNRFFRDTEQQMQRCVDRFYDAMHSVASLKNIIEIGLQTFKAVGGAYAVSQSAKKSKKKSTHSEDEE